MRVVTNHPKRLPISNSWPRPLTKELSRLLPPQSPGPQVIGVAHLDENIDLAKKIIDGLRPASKIGLEMDMGAPRMHRYLGQGREVVGAMCDEEGARFFTELANYARTRGHTPLWVERPSAHIVKSDRDAIRKAGEVLRMPERYVFGWVRSAFFNYWYTQAEIIGRMTVLWRSKLMLRATRNYGFGPTDAVFIGHKHALDFVTFTGQGIEARIVDGRVTTPSIRECKSEDLWNHSDRVDDRKLRVTRSIQRLIHRWFGHGVADKARKFRLSVAGVCRI